MYELCGLDLHSKSQGVSGEMEMEVKAGIAREKEEQMGQPSGRRRKGREMRRREGALGVEAEKERERSMGNKYEEGIKTSDSLVCSGGPVTKYNYFVTVLKYIFQVSVLYWSSFILSNFYFYFTTFQSIRSYFLLHYIS